MLINCYIQSDWQEGIIEKILPGVFIGRLVCANNKFEGREAKGLSKGRYDETFVGEDGFHLVVCIYNQSRKQYES